MRERDGGGPFVCRRQALIGAALALAPWAASPARAEVVDQDEPPDPRWIGPQKGDHLVFLTGPKKGSPVHVDDLTLGAEQLQAYPAAPDGTVRDGSRLNLLIVAKVGNDGMSEDTLARSADGVVAYSGVCTHQGCAVNMWIEDDKHFVCSCHGSVYDPKDGAEVVDGPAPRHLAALPLKSDKGLLVVAGAFVGKLGVQN
jgi:rieske iron-sulfur protein